MTSRPWTLGDLPIPVIDAFVGEYEFMSNLWPAPTLTAAVSFPPVNTPTPPPRPMTTT